MALADLFISQLGRPCGLLPDKVLPLTSCDFCSQILSVYERSIEGCFYFRKRNSADIYEKYPFLVFFGATDGNFMEKYSVTPS